MGFANDTERQLFERYGHLGYLELGSVDKSGWDYGEHRAFANVVELPALRRLKVTAPLTGICLCLHHRCGRPVRDKGTMCDLCKARKCEAPEALCDDTLHPTDFDEVCSAKCRACFEVWKTFLGFWAGWSRLQKRIVQRSADFRWTGPDGREFKILKPPRVPFYST